MIAMERKVDQKTARKVLNNQNIRHYHASMIYSQEVLVANDFLIELSTEALRKAWQENLEIRNDQLGDSAFFATYPGQHFRLLKAITRILNPQNVVAVGTVTGMGTIATQQGLLGGLIPAVDIIPWHAMSTHLSEADCAGGQVTQILGELSAADCCAKHLDILNNASLILVDAPKDGVFEYQFMSLLTSLDKKKGRVMVLDDIRFVNMVDLWCSIKSPKLDLSSFGHWSGTGIVDLSDGLEL